MRLAVLGEQIQERRIAGARHAQRRRGDDDLHAENRKRETGMQGVSREEAIGKINAMPVKPSFMIHTGDITQLAKPSEFDTANEVLKAQERKMRLQKLKGELVDRARAIALVFRLARQERDAEDAHRRDDLDTTLTRSVTLPEEVVAQEFQLKLYYAGKTSEGVRMTAGPIARAAGVSQRRGCAWRPSASSRSCSGSACRHSCVPARRVSRRGRASSSCSTAGVARSTASTPSPMPPPRSGARRSTSPGNGAPTRSGAAAGFAEAAQAAFDVGEPAADAAVARFEPAADQIDRPLGAARAQVHETSYGTSRE